jgi:hypothetical protein
MIRSARKAAHDSCVACHHDLAAKKIKTGPVECSGCHDAAAQAGIQTLTDVPRLQRNQPDIVLLTGWDSLGMTRMPMPGSLPRTWIRWRSTMYCMKPPMPPALPVTMTAWRPALPATPRPEQTKGAMSNWRMPCTGRTAQPAASGATRRRPGPATVPGATPRCRQRPSKDQPCAACHNVDVRNLPQKQLSDRTATADLAEQMLEQRAWTYEKVALDQVPDIVTIGVLSNEYQPSRFPHRLVVEAVFEKADQNEMARAFHGQELTLCTGCHHNSPATLNPPKCASCHGIAPDLAADKPGLLGAYHGQCITCHQEMAVTSVPATDCIKCHEKK